jgi:hypothetical protein
MAKRYGKSFSKCNWTERPIDNTAVPIYRDCLLLELIPNKKARLTGRAGIKSFLIILLNHLNRGSTNVLLHRTLLQWRLSHFH